MKQRWKRCIKGVCCAGLVVVLLAFFQFLEKYIESAFSSIHEHDAAMVVLSESWDATLGIPHLLRDGGGTIRSAAMNMLQFEGCVNVQTMFSDDLSQLFFLMECVSYIFHNKKICQKIRNLQEFPLRNVFFFCCFRVRFFPSVLHQNISSLVFLEEHWKVHFSKAKSTSQIPFFFFQKSSTRRSFIFPHPSSEELY